VLVPISGFSIIDCVSEAWTTAIGFLITIAALAQLGAVAHIRSCHQ
jgi:hypothetical protein